VDTRKESRGAPWPTMVVLNADQMPEEWQWYPDRHSPEFENSPEKFQAAYDHWVLRFRLIRMVRDIRDRIERCSPVQLDELAKQVDTMERAIYGISARDRRLVILDEEARRLGPKYDGDPSTMDPGIMRVWHELLAAYGRPAGRPRKDAPKGGRMAALLAYARFEGFFATEMSLLDFRRTLIEAKRRLRKTQGPRTSE